MADLRDAISNNDLKLPDITDLGELVQGDRLLQTDRAFSEMLDGVYRRGTVYQRWPQVLSSLAFGTAHWPFPDTVCRRSLWRCHPGPRMPATPGAFS